MTCVCVYDVTCVCMQNTNIDFDMQRVHTVETLPPIQYSCPGVTHGLNSDILYHNVFKFLSHRELLKLTGVCHFFRASVRLYILEHGAVRGDARNIKINSHYFSRDEPQKYLDEVACKVPVDAIIDGGWFCNMDKVEDVVSRMTLSKLTLRTIHRDMLRGIVERGCLTNTVLEITSPRVHSLVPLNHITTVILSHTSLDSNVLSYLGGVENLTISMCTGGGLGWGSLSGAKSLKIVGCAIDTDALSSISRVPRIELCYCESVEHVDHLLNVPYLRLVGLLLLTPPLFKGENHVEVDDCSFALCDDPDEVFSKLPGGHAHTFRTSNGDAYMCLE